jgi:membrane dipeptidase
VPMFVAQSSADWYAECLDITDERGGDRRRASDVVPVLQERLRTHPPPPCTADDVADQIDYIREVAGLDHVGLGGDYDGSEFFPEGMADVSGYPLVFDALRRRGWSEGELAQLGHSNVLRAMRQMEDARA